MGQEQRTEAVFDQPWVYGEALVGSVQHSYASLSREPC
jgi:hypothetical protein